MFAILLPSEQDRHIQMILLRVLAATVSGAKDDPGQTTLRALPHHCASALVLTRDPSLYTHLLHRVWASRRDVVDYFVRSTDLLRDLARIEIKDLYSFVDFGTLLSSAAADGARVGWID
jgi:hypothetical protein